MILDSSAIIAILLREPGYEGLLEKLLDAGAVGAAAPTLLESGVVLGARLGFPPQSLLDRFLREFEVATVVFGDEHWREALDAWMRFGKGRHPAELNFGDCVSYAAARLSGRPLLCRGEDFVKTDLELA